MLSVVLSAMSWPIAPAEAQVRHLIDEAKSHRRVVMICHVLRYAPFYQAVKRLVEQGEIGRIISMNTTERVSYHHMVSSFVRSRWNRSDCSAGMLMRKRMRKIPSD